MDGLGLCGLDVAGELLRILDFEFQMTQAANLKSAIDNPQSGGRVARRE